MLPLDARRPDENKPQKNELCERTLPPPPTKAGDVVVPVVDGRLTVKTLAVEKYVLRPEKPAYDVIRLGESLEVLGIVTDACEVKPRHQNSAPRALATEPTAARQCAPGLKETAAGSARCNMHRRSLTRVGAPPRFATENNP